jgi:hypothetical protein
LRKTSIDGVVSIEAKMVDRRSLRALETDLTEQLIDRYLRDRRSRFGVYLLGRVSTDRWMSPDGHALDFPQVISRLQDAANRRVALTPDVDAVRVFGIDFAPTAAGSARPARAMRGRKGRPKARSH